MPVELAKFVGRKLAGWRLRCDGDGCERSQLIVAAESLPAVGTEAGKHRWEVMVRRGGGVRVLCRGCAESQRATDRVVALWMEDRRGA